MINIIKKYFNLLDNIITDFLTDIKSLRYQLIIWAYALNIYVFNMIYDGKADYKLASITVALLTLVYGMYFQSKRHQSEMESKQAPEEDEPAVERDPEL
jgi:hypothetical protein